MKLCGRMRVHVALRVVGTAVEWQLEISNYLEHCGMTEGPPQTEKNPVE